MKGNCRSKISRQSVGKPYGYPGHAAFWGATQTQPCTANSLHKTKATSAGMADVAWVTVKLWKDCLTLSSDPFHTTDVFRIRRSFLAAMPHSSRPERRSYWHVESLKFAILVCQFNVLV